MSPALANTLGVTVYAVSLSPLVAAAFSVSVRKIMLVYVAALIGLIAVQTGIFHGSSLASTNIVVRVRASANDEQCEQIWDLMRQSGLSIDRSDLAAPRIVGNGADQIPPEVRDALLACAELPGTAGRNVRPANARD